MRLLDEQYTATPFYGRKKMTMWLHSQGHEVNEKRVGRLLRKMGLAAIYPKPQTSQSAVGHRIYPYRLRKRRITAPNQVWSTDITYIRMCGGFMYLVAIIDWFSRYILTWQLSNTLEGSFCIDALHAALTMGKPTIFNTDQGSQFTAHAFTDVLEQAAIQISMDGRGRALDNIFIERFWRSLKYEHIYLHDYTSVPDLQRGLTNYFHFYNQQRFHQALDYRTPAQVHFDATARNR